MMSHSVSFILCLLSVVGLVQCRSFAYYDDYYYDLLPSYDDYRDYDYYHERPPRRQPRPPPRPNRVLEEEDKEDFDMVKEAQKLAGDTRTLAGLVDDVSGMRDYDLVSDIFGDLGGSGNNGGLREISTMMKNTANFMDKGTSILSKLTQRFGGRVKK